MYTWVLVAQLYSQLSWWVQAGIAGRWCILQYFPFGLSVLSYAAFPPLWGHIPLWNYCCVPCLWSFAQWLSLALTSLQDHLSSPTKIKKHINIIPTQIYRVPQKCVHPSHICRYLIIYFYRTTLNKRHFVTMKSSGCLRGVFGVNIMLEHCPATQFPEAGDHALLQYFTVHILYSLTWKALTSFYFCQYKKHLFK